MRRAHGRHVLGEQTFCLGAVGDTHVKGPESGHNNVSVKRGFRCHQFDQRYLINDNK